MPFVSHEYLLEVGNCTCVFSVGHSDVREPLLHGDLRRVQLAISLFRKYVTFAHTGGPTFE